MERYIKVSKNAVHLIGIHDPQFDQPGVEYLITQGSSRITHEYNTPEYDEALLKAIKLAQSFII